MRHIGRSDSAYRMILPFCLIIAVILLLVFRLVPVDELVHQVQRLEEVHVEVWIAAILGSILQFVDALILRLF